MIQVVRSLLTGMPPVAAPGDLELYECGNADGLDEGVVVQISSGSENVATVDLADEDASNAFGITVDEAEDDNDTVRVQIITSGMVLKGEADSAVDVGDTVQLNSDRDGFDDGTGSAFYVIDVEKDNDGDWKVAHVVPISGQLEIV